MCSSERKDPELFITHLTFVYSPLLGPSMACQTQTGVFFETPCMFEICQFELKTFSSEARSDVGTAKVSQLRCRDTRDRRQTRDKYLMISPQTPTLF